MVPVFSASAGELGETSVADLQLLADQELMSLWEQTQMAAAAILSHGGIPRAARRYEQAVVIELQRRLASRPKGVLFSSRRKESKDPADVMPHIMVVRA
jgi:hypothetical protein